MASSFWMRITWQRSTSLRLWGLADVQITDDSFGINHSVVFLKMP